MIGRLSVRCLLTLVKRDEEDKARTNKTVSQLDCDSTVVDSADRRTVPNLLATARTRKRREHEINHVMLKKHNKTKN
jgi:hypothetical protein